jgi:hypothetical protein
MNAEKMEFLRTRFTALLRQIPSDTPPLWGKMTLQQMIEHFSESVRIASGRMQIHDIITPPDQEEKMRAFLLSEKPFRENTPNPLLPEVPAPVKKPSVKEALHELDEEIAFFFETFRKNDVQVTRNPFFGDLNFEQNIQLLYKHAIHHLRQFGVEITQEAHHQ